MFDAELIEAAAGVLEIARRKGVMIATAESCTGGLVAAVLTAIPGSSDVVDGGTVTYSNAAKVRLGVPRDLLARHGAVSEAVARTLAEAAQRRTGGPALAVSVTGVAGPGGGTAQKPVGLVHFAATDGTRTIHREERFGDRGRDGIRRASVFVAFDCLIEIAG